ncbi:MAG: PIN domain-containing protein [Bacteroidales bacterium]|nr:PIN domain-containing protein [Bacteroidales bacterium]
MVKYLLDSCIIISALRGDTDIQKKINCVGIQNCGISELVLAELYAGPYKLMQTSTDERSRHRARLQIESLHLLEEKFEILPWQGCSEEYAREHVRLASLGQGIEDIDLMIGAYASRNGYIMVTGNARHFERIERLRIENWYKGQ